MSGQPTLTHVFPITDKEYTNNLIALLNLYEIIFVCIKSSLYERTEDIQAEIKQVASMLGAYPQLTT